jgi:hypothetical protein
MYEYMHYIFEAEAKLGSEFKLTKFGVVHEETKTCAATVLLSGNFSLMRQFLDFIIVIKSSF